MIKNTRVSSSKSIICHPKACELLWLFQGITQHNHPLCSKARRNLRSLQISENKPEDTRVKLLHEAVKPPIWHAENLGLEACEGTATCCEDLPSCCIYPQNMHVCMFTSRTSTLYLHASPTGCKENRANNYGLNFVCINSQRQSNETYDFLY